MIATKANLRLMQNTPGCFWMKDENGLVWFRDPAGHVATLSNHHIGSDGTVTPSVQCPQGCGFHEENLRLESWR